MRFFVMHHDSVSQFCSAYNNLMSDVIVIRQEMAVLSSATACAAITAHNQTGSVTNLAQTNSVNEKVGWVTTRYLNARHC